MIPESTQELAALFVFELLEPAELRAFEVQLAENAELSRLVDELRETAAGIAHGAPGRMPPPELEGRILEQIRETKKVIAFPKYRPFVPWAIAAMFAIFCGVLFLHELQLKKSLEAAIQVNPLDQVQVALLGSKFENVPAASAVVVWDPKQQEGVIQLSGVPEPEAGKDYQLWIIDPAYPTPVDGGILPVRTDGISTISFRGNRMISDAEKFAISLEKTGGVPVAKGPIVMIGP